jgi:AhpD family alkylhydroperoxidase
MSAPRVPYTTLAPDAFGALISLGKAIAQSPLEPVLVDLVYLRVSQMNGCAYCVDLHWRDLVKSGVDLQRLNSLPTWREVPAFYSPREQAALAWAESMTDLHASHVSDDDFAALRPHFSDAEIAHLSFAVASMNAWNRMGISMRLPVARKPLLAAV